MSSNSIPMIKITSADSNHNSEVRVPVEDEPTQDGLTTDWQTTSRKRRSRNPDEIIQQKQHMDETDPVIQKEMNRTASHRLLR